MRRARAKFAAAFSRRCGRGERGATTVEMALVTIILLTIVFGLIEMCLALYTYHFVSEAAREGTRFAIVRGSACAAPGYECDATAAQIKTYVRGLGFPGVDSANMTVTTTWSAYPAGGSCSPSANCNNPGNLVQVKVAYGFPLSIPFLRSRTISMASTSAMVISQ